MEAPVHRSADGRAVRREYKLGRTSWQAIDSTLLTAVTTKGIARTASQAHWVSDVLAGAALGTVVGYYASHRLEPLVLSVGGAKGVFVGLRTKF